MSPNFNSLKIKFWTKTVNKEYPVWSKDTLLLHNIYKSFKLNFAVGVMTHQQACVSSVPQRVNSLLMLPRAKSFVFLYFLVLETTANQKTFYILNINVLGKRRNWFSPVPKLLQVWKPRCFLVAYLILNTASLFPSQDVATSWDVQLVVNNVCQSFFPQSWGKTI